jgi:chemotaxis signal transduction protein
VSLTAPTTDGTTRPTEKRPDGVLIDAEDDARPRVLVVRVADTEYGIPVGQVREVFRGDRVTRVPGSPSVVRGIVNVRGAVVTVLELGELLGAVRAVTSTSVVLLEHGSRLIGLAVDAVRDVRTQDADSADAEQAECVPVTPLDAVALCAPHLLSSEEMGR